MLCSELDTRKSRSVDITRPDVVYQVTSKGPNCFQWDVIHSSASCTATFGVVPLFTSIDATVSRELAGPSITKNSCSTQYFAMQCFCKVCICARRPAQPCSRSEE